MEADITYPKFIIMAVITVDQLDTSWATSSEVVTTVAAVITAVDIIECYILLTRVSNYIS